MLPQKFSNPVSVPNAANVLTIDGSLGDVFIAVIAANSTLIVKNVAPGKEILVLINSSGAFTVAANGATVQALTLSGAAASFTCKNATQGFKITGTTATAAFMSMTWDGLYA